MTPDPNVQPGFFIKLAEIPDLLDKLADPEFNEALSADPGGVLAGLGISFPEGLVPETVSLPEPARVSEIRDALETLRPQEGDEFLWFPFFAAGFIKWFPAVWFPFFRRGEET